MTVDAYLNFIFELKKCKIPRKSHLKDICELTKISNVRERIIKNLSKGYRQRVGLAQALIGNPPVLILDEPTVGLDPKQILEIRNLIKKLGKNHTVILSSHILPEVQAVCDRIIIINQGKIVADDTEYNLSQKISNDHRLLARIAGDKNEVLKVLKSVKDVLQIRADIEREPGAYEYDIEAREGADIRKDMFNALAEHKMPLIMLKSAALTLEDIFLKITVGDENPDINTQEKKEVEKAKKLTEQLEKLGFGQTKVDITNEVETQLIKEKLIAAQMAKKSAFEGLTDEKADDNTEVEKKAETEKTTEKIQQTKGGKK
jgi:ABC-2 type transport system ATP-binding protein